MLNFRKHWLPEMIGYAELIADDSILRRAWLEGDVSQTSVISYDELVCQIFDDLQADRHRELMRIKLQDYPTLSAKIDEFLDLIEQVGNGFDQDDARLLDSRDWKLLQQISGKLIEVAHQAGFSSDDFDPDS